MSKKDSEENDCLVFKFFGKRVFEVLKVWVEKMKMKIEDIFFGLDGKVEEKDWCKILFFVVYILGILVKNLFFLVVKLFLGFCKKNYIGNI